MTTDPTTAETDARFAKLPKWAQQRITVLESNVAWWQKKANVDNEPTAVFLDRYEHPTFIPEDERIGFGNHDSSFEKITVRLDRDMDGTVLHVSGGQSLAVFPAASNVVRIKLVER